MTDTGTDAGVITRLLHAIDARDWDGVRASLADKVDTDYTSLWGGSPETAAADALVAQWAEFMKQFGATHHLTGPLVVDGNRVETHVMAHHWKTAADGGQAWTLYGHYIATVVDSKITSLTLRTYRAEGHPAFPQILSPTDR